MLARNERPGRGLALAVVAGLVFFSLGWFNVYEARMPSAQPARVLPAEGARTSSAAANGSDPVRAGALHETAGAGVATIEPRSVPPPRSWAECNFSRLQRYYPRELAAERASAAALRTTRVLPTLFVPCCPKAGTTFLNRCVSQAFHPSVVCGDADPASWAGEGCAGKSYLLGGVRSNGAGSFSEVKEPFYFNKVEARRAPGAARDLAVLAGPPLPLCMWQREMGAPARPNFAREDPAAFWQRLATRARAPCNVSVALPPPGAPSPAGNHFPAGAWPGCWLGPPERNARSGYADALGFKVAFPLAAELPAGRALTYDMTPNYLCSAHALRLMRERYGPELSARARFIVMLREPVARAFSEFSMFRSWGWEKEPEFGRAVAGEIRQLRRCLRNDTLLLRPVVLAAMEPARVVADAMRCGAGEAREYVRNSLYEVCIAGAYAYFARRQFMFVFAEDLREMAGAELARKVEAFTRLTLRRAPSGEPAATIAQGCDTGTQSRGGRRALPNHQTKGRIEPELAARLRRFFAPSRAALASLLEGTFHAEQPLARLAALAREDPDGPAGEERVVSGFGLDLSGAARPPQKRPRRARRTAGLISPAGVH